MNRARTPRLRRVAEVLLAVGLVTAAVFASSTQAGSNRTSAKILFAPHVLTVGAQGFLRISFTNQGPSKVNHVLATVTDASGNPVPIAAADFDQSSVPAGCSVVAVTSSSSSITCDIGQVGPGTVTRQIKFTPSATAQFVPRVSATFDESKGTQLTDTVFDTDFPFFAVSATDQSQRGRCQVTPEELTAFDAAQQTSVTAPSVTSVYGCTPVSAGLDAVHQPSNVGKHFGEISFVDFLGTQMAPVTIMFKTVPAGITKNNIGVYELPNFSPAGGAEHLIATNGGAPVPACDAQGNITKKASDLGYVSCVVGFDNSGGGGVIASLRSKGNADPGWGGIG